MKIVGNLLSGGVLLEVSLEEYGTLIGTAITLAALPTLTVPVALATMPANKASGGLTVKPEESPAAGSLAVNNVRNPLSPIHKALKAKKSGARLCAFCKKPLPKDVSPLEKTHKGNCKKEYGRAYARNHWQEKAGKPAAAKVGSLTEVPPSLNPSDLNLTDAALPGKQTQAKKVKPEKTATKPETGFGQDEPCAKCGHPKSEHVFDGRGGCVHEIQVNDSKEACACMAFADGKKRKKSTAEKI